VVRNPVDEGVVGVVVGGLGGGLGGGVGGGVVGGGGVGGGGGGIVDADGGVGDWWPGRKKHRFVGKSVREKMISDPPRCNPL
jgi:hypothetical protein